MTKLNSGKNVILGPAMGIAFSKQKKNRATYIKNLDNLLMPLTTK